MSDALETRQITWFTSKSRCFAESIFISSVRLMSRALRTEAVGSFYSVSKRFDSPNTFLSVLFKLVSVNCVYKESFRSMIQSMTRDIHKKDTRRRIYWRKEVGYWDSQNNSVNESFQWTDSKEASRFALLTNVGFEPKQSHFCCGHKFVVSDGNLPWPLLSLSRIGSFSTANKRPYQITWFDCIWLPWLSPACLSQVLNPTLL